MSATVSPLGSPGARARARSRFGSISNLGDGLLFGLCAFASLIALAVLVEIAYQLIHGAAPAISHFGLGFLGDTAWKPNFNVFGAGTVLFGTAVSSLMALTLAAPLGVAIGLFLSTTAPRALRGVVGPLVEMLAAIPSVVLGFWGILVLAPFLQRQVEPWLHGTLGFLPIFGATPTTGSSIFTAGLILTIMVLPIIASISRDLFLSVPRDLQDGASALGATRWEVVRGVLIPSTASGVVAACFLGLGRALGEAIAVAQVIGAGTLIHANLFQTGDTLASRIALQFPGAISKLHIASLFYLAVMLLAIGLLTNLLAQWIAGRFDYQRAVAR